MKKIIIPIFLMMLLCVMTSCPSGYFQYYIVNNSDDTLCIYSGIGLNDGEVYPDTGMPLTDLPWIAFPGSICYAFYPRPSLEEMFDKYFLNDTAWVAIVSKDTVKKYGWEDVRANYRVMVRYDLSYQDFMTLNLKIPYPPSPAMANMKMYPPYEEVIKRK